MATHKKWGQKAGRLLLAALLALSVLGAIPAGGGKAGIYAAGAVSLAEAAMLADEAAQAETAASIVAAASQAGNYVWGNVPIGGGGYVTGIALHPQEQDLAYIRTDVGGIFRWNETDKSWKQLIGFANRSENNLYGGESIALDPQNPDIIYAALGKQDYWSPSDVYKSTDRGETWTATGLRHNGSYVKMAANGAQRTAGERLAVDPANSNVVYFGSRYDGLFRSTSGASAGSWQKVGGLAPSGAAVNGAPVGVSFVLFDPDSGTTPDGRTKTIYAGYYFYGVYVSRDAGETWQLLPGSPVCPIQGTLNSDGSRLYVTHYEGIAKLEAHVESAGFEDITPEPEAATGSRPGQPFSAFAIDPRDDDVLITARRQDAHGNPIYRSTDGGLSWNELAFSKNGLVPWTPSWHWSSATSAIAIDPFQPDRVWFADWYYAWRTEDISPEGGLPPTFSNYAKGLETVVNVSNMASPPGGDRILHTGIADNGGFDHASLEQFPSGTYFTGTAGLHELTTTGVDVLESDPNFVVRVGTYGWNGDGRETPGNGGYSEDGGLTYTAFDSLPYSKAQGGRVAVSATSADQIVWMPQRGGVYYTPNRGETWLPSAGVPSGLLAGDHIFANYYIPLAADKVNGNWFYVYDKAGKFYRSSDGGRNWAQTASLPSQSAAWHTVQAAPGVMGEVWVSLNQSGLYRSGDAGSTFQKVGGVEEAFLFSFGKNAPGRLNPSVFVYGKLAGIAKEGVFRSDDMGVNWVRVNLDNPFPGNDPNAMTGDRQVHGRVFIGTNGSGIRYGEPVQPPSAPDYSYDTSPPSVPQALQATELTPTSIALRWSSSSDSESGVKGYRIFVNGVLSAETYGTAHLLRGLAPDTAYVFQVQAVDLAGNVSIPGMSLQASTPALSATPPQPPTSLHAEKASSVAVKLIWQPGSGPAPAGYYIYRGTSEDFVPSPANRLGLTGNAAYNDTTIQANQYYYYKVAAIDGEGRISEPSSALEVYTSILVPLNIIVDNLDSGFSSDSPWLASTYSASRYGANYFHNGKAGGKWAKWSPELPETGSYNVYMLWNASEDRDNAVPISIAHVNGVKTGITVNQRQSDNQWVWLGKYEFQGGAGGGGYVRLGSNAGATAIADAVKFTLDSSDPYGADHPA